MARAKRTFVPDEPISSAASTEISALFSDTLAQRRVVPMEIEIARIGPNPFQARHTFTGVEELADAIRAQGFTSRLRVRRDLTIPGHFQLVYGERRLRAATEAGLTTIPCDVGDHTDDELLEIGLAENIQRRDLDPLEEAVFFRQVIDERGYSIRTLAQRIGKDKSYVENRLFLLRVPQDVQELVAQRPDTLRVARMLAKLPSESERRPLIEGVMSGDLTQQDVQASIAMSEQRRSTSDEPSTSSAGNSAKRPTEMRTTSNATTVLQQQIERDKEKLLMTLSRWRMARARLSDTDAASMLAFIQNQLLPQLEGLTEELDGQA